MVTTLHELCQAIAEALGPEWQVTPTQKNPIWDYCFTRSSDGLELHCRLLCIGYQRNRLEFQVNSIEGVAKNGTVIFRYTRDNPSITVLATRDPKAIAKDIARRLLPGATAWWQEGMIGKRVAEEQYAQAQQLQARLLEFPSAASLKPTYAGEDFKVRGPNECWIASINHRILTFRSLTSDQMIALLEAYHQLKETP